jgi:hypothetical protein
MYPNEKKHRRERQGRAAIPGVPLPVLQGVRARRAGGGAPDPTGRYPRPTTHKHVLEKNLPQNLPDGPDVHPEAAG